jgi:hypothetical protein
MAREHTDGKRRREKCLFLSNQFRGIYLPDTHTQREREREEIN